MSYELTDSMQLSLVQSIVVDAIRTIQGGLAICHKHVDSVVLAFNSETKEIELTVMVSDEPTQPATTNPNEKEPT